jgi:hypothetical protein
MINESKKINKNLYFTLILLISFLHGCGTTSYVYQSGSALPIPVSKSVLILPPDVVISLRNAGGNLEANPEWSAQVQSSMVLAIEESLYEKGVDFELYETKEIQDEHIDIFRQSAVLMDAIEGGARADRVYSISENSLQSLSMYDSNYILITEYKGERASGGRQAVAILSAMAGIATTTSTSTFRVGLFDLRDGQLRWFNVDPEAQTDIGDVLNASEEKWTAVVDHLLKDFPL